MPVFESSALQYAETKLRASFPSVPRSELANRGMRALKVSGDALEYCRWDLAVPALRLALPADAVLVVCETFPLFQLILDAGGIYDAYWILFASVSWSKVRNGTVIPTLSVTWGDARDPKGQLVGVTADVTEDVLLENVRQVIRHSDLRDGDLLVVESHETMDAILRAVAHRSDNPNVSIVISDDDEAIEHVREPILLKELTAILLEHTGETGVSEGAVDTLRRIVADHRMWAQMTRVDALELSPKLHCSESERLETVLLNVAATHYAEQIGSCCGDMDWTGCDLTAEHHPKCKSIKGG